jgi:hypothetical protein
MSLTVLERKQWATAYIEAQLLPQGEVGADHPLWWAIERTQLPETLERAEEVWEFLLEALSLSPPDKVIGMLGAGPMEDLLDDWGPEFIDRIEAEAARSAAFRKMLGRVWESGPPAVWARVQSLRAASQ